MLIDLHIVLVIRTSIVLYIYIYIYVQNIHGHQCFLIRVFCMLLADSRNTINTRFFMNTLTLSLDVSNYLLYENDLKAECIEMAPLKLLFVWTNLERCASAGWNQHLAPLRRRRIGGNIIPFFQLKYGTCRKIPPMGSCKSPKPWLASGVGILHPWLWVPTYHPRK